MHVPTPDHPHNKENVVFTRVKVNEMFVFPSWSKTSVEMLAPHVPDAAVRFGWMFTMSWTVWQDERRGRVINTTHCMVNQTKVLVNATSKYFMLHEPVVRSLQLHATDKCTADKCYR